MLLATKVHVHVHVLSVCTYATATKQNVYSNGCPFGNPFKEANKFLLNYFSSTYVQCMYMHKAIHDIYI